MIRAFTYLALFIGVLLAPYSNFGSIECFVKNNRKANRIHVTKKNDEGRGEHLMVQGMSLFLNQEYDKALKKFETIVHEDNANAAANFMAARCHQATKNTTLHIEYARKAVELAVDNADYRNLLIDGYRQTKNLEAITALYEQLIDNKKAHRRDYLVLAETYYQRAIAASEDLILMEEGSKKYKKAQNDITFHCGNTIVTYDRMRDNYGPDQDVSKTIVHLYTHFSEHEKAKLESLSNIKSFNDDPILIYAHCQRFYKRFPQETLEYLQESINQHPNDVSLKLLAHDFFSIEGNDSYAKLMLTEAFDNESLTLEHRIQIIRSYTNEIDLEKLRVAEELAQITVKRHSKDALAYFMLGDVQSALKKNNDALTSYNQGLKIEPSSSNYWERILQIHMSAQNYDAAIAAGGESLKYDTVTSSIFWYIGVANQLNKNHTAAKDALEKGRDLAYDPDIKFQFNSQLGDVYNELKLYTESDAAFDAALLYDPNNDHCLNNYSYFLSLRNEKLIEAEAMCKRLMRLRPNLANYMDTYAWVLYKLEKYIDAKNLFEQALKTSSDATIWEHYGRTLIELNQKKEAIEAFKLAIKNGGDKNEIQLLIDSLNE